MGNRYNVPQNKLPRKPLPTVRTTNLVVDDYSRISLTP